MTQAEKTLAVIAMIDRNATELGETEAPLIAHARELARKLDAVAKAMKRPAGSWEEVGKRDKVIRAILDRP